MSKKVEGESGKKKIVSTIKRNQINIILAVIIMIIVVCVMTYSKKYGNIETYTVVNGYIEKESDTTAYLVKTEKVASVSNSDVAIPVIEQGKKAAKDEIISIYKDSSYTKYLSEIEKMDKDIQTLISDLPATYSSDVKEIDKQISEISNQALRETSYIRMQEYKNKLDELAYRKVLILGALSPEGSKIRELIEQREEYENKSKTSSNNIKAPITGLVSYKIDGLEDVADPSKIYSYSVDDLENIIKQYKNNTQNKFGIKVIDNYHAYLIVKEEKGPNDEYIKKGNEYLIKLTDQPDVKLSSTLVKVIEKDNYKYCILEITNGIENIIDLREISLSIVWKKTSGIALPKDYIQENKEKGYKYVTLISLGQYVDVPIEIVLESDNICIIENMDREKVENLGLSTEYTIELYDQILYKNN